MLGMPREGTIPGPYYVEVCPNIHCPHRKKRRI